MAKLGFIGGCFGATLLLLALAAAGAGHGSFVLLGLFSSPVGVVATKLKCRLRRKVKVSVRPGETEPGTAAREGTWNELYNTEQPWSQLSTVESLNRVERC